MKRSMLRHRILAVFLGFMMLFGSVNLEVFASPAEEDEISYEIRMVEDGEVSEYGCQAVKFIDEEGNVIDIREQLVPEVQAFSEFPEKYNIYEEMDMPSVKNQGALGLCWAHAVLACAEANMVLQGLVDASVDYSELHLAWFTNMGSKPLETDPMEGDGRLDEAGELIVLGKKAFNQGCNIYQSMAALARWSGAVDEEIAPYPNPPYPPSSEDAESEDRGDILAESLTELSEDLRYESVAHLQGVELYAPSDQESIKRAVMEYGGVYCEFFSGDYFDNVEVEGETLCVYYTGQEVPINHSVTIVGWDDSFDKSNFKKAADEPKENGAWIVKNSWGGNWGTNGFFYMSYEEPSVSIAASFQMEDSSNYDNNYQYDGSAGGVSIGQPEYLSTKTYAGANQFTAKGREMLKAVGFYTDRAGLDYTISVYIGGEDPLNSGEPRLTESGVLDYGGYHTIQLNNKIELQEGEEFAVAVMFHDKDGRAYVYLDNHTSKGSKSYSYWNNEWKETQGGNCRIKAYTTNIPPEAISSVEITDIMAPAIRQTLDGEAICKVEGIKTVEDKVPVLWKDGETVLSDGPKAEFGIAYTATVTLEAEDDYYFFDDLIVQLGGISIPEKNMKISSDNKTLTITYTYEPIQEIKTVELVDFAVPVGGRNLATEITCSSEGIEEIASEDIIWKKEEEVVTEKAQYNTIYCVNVALKAKEGYGFTDDTTVTVNSDAAEGIVQENGMDLTVIYTFPITPKAKLIEDIASSISIDGVANGTQKTAADLGLPEKMAITTEDETVKWASITWDLEHLADATEYDSTIKTEQIFKVNGEADLDSIAIDANGKSTSVTATVTVAAADIAGAPVPDVVAGVYTENQLVRLTSSTERATIYYTLDENADPLENGIAYTEPILLEGIKGESKVITIRAIAVREDMRDSAVVTFEYTITLPEEEYSITVTNDGNGTASASATSAKAGEEITLQSTPNKNYRLKEWQVTSGSAVVVNHSFVMPSEDVVIHATFEKAKSGSNHLDPIEPKFEDVLTTREKEIINNILSDKVQTVVKCSTGKLIISEKQEIVFCENNLTLSENKWQKVEDAWYYFGADKKAVNGWLLLGEKWYFMNPSNKKMETGWVQTGGKWYLLDKTNGDMKSGWQFVNGKWYLLDKTNGDMKSDWQLVNDKWYYMDLMNGDMKTGWIKWNHAWYYLDIKKGEMLATTTTPDGYKVDENGVWIP